MMAPTKRCKTSDTTKLLVPTILNKEPQKMDLHSMIEEELKATKPDLAEQV